MTLCRESGLDAPFLAQAVATQQKHGVASVIPHVQALGKALRGAGGAGTLV